MSPDADFDKFMRAIVSVPKERALKTMARTIAKKKKRTHAKQSATK